MRKLSLVQIVVGILFVCAAEPARTQAAEGGFTFNHGAGFLTAQCDGQTVFTYVYRDPKIHRPYFTQVQAPDGRQVSRNLPPAKGQDPTDHERMHPGLWMAFGDLNGHDFWRNRAIIQHEQFLQPPALRDGTLTFTVENRYLAPGRKPVCSETSRYTLTRERAGFLLIWDSTFHAGAADVLFGDQEEMGLGVRLHTPLTVANGGVILNSAGGQNEAGTRGTTPKWIDYSGIVDEKPAGITFLIDPANFRPSWIHARDYGLLVVNPFGRQALTGTDKSTVRIPAGETLRLRYGVLLHSDRTVDLPAAYKSFLNRLQKR